MNFADTDIEKYIDQNFINVPLTHPTYIANRNLYKALKQIAPKYASGKLVDLGCGIKPYEGLFLPHVDEYFGVDLKKTASANYAEITCADLDADICDTKLESESVDTLLSTQVLEHIYETNRYISECYRLLKIGGVAIFTVPQTYECHAKPYDYYRFTEFSLKYLFEDHGFIILELFPLEGAYATIQQLKIVSVIFGRYKNKAGRMTLFDKIIYKLYQYTVVPYLNCLGAIFDKKIGNYDLCLNHIIVVKKIKPQSIVDPINETMC
jgi:SAM-dependent methyltransferase